MPHSTPLLHQNPKSAICIFIMAESSDASDSEIKKREIAESDDESNIFVSAVDTEDLFELEFSKMMKRMAKSDGVKI